jgi:hypothetical protein
MPGWAVSTTSIRKGLIQALTCIGHEKSGHGHNGQDYEQELEPPQHVPHKSLDSGQTPTPSWRPPTPAQFLGIFPIRRQWRIRTEDGECGGNLSFGPLEEAFVFGLNAGVPSDLGAPGFGRGPLVVTTAVVVCPGIQAIGCRSVFNGTPGCPSSIG